MLVLVAHHLETPLTSHLSACWRGPPRINVAPRAVLKSSIRSVVSGQVRRGGRRRSRSVWVKNSFSPYGCPTHYIRHLFSGNHVYTRVQVVGDRGISSERKRFDVIAPSSSRGCKKVHSLFSSRRRSRWAGGASASERKRYLFIPLMGRTYACSR